MSSGDWMHIARYAENDMCLVRGIKFINVLLKASIFATGILILFLVRFILFAFTNFIIY